MVHLNYWDISPLLGLKSILLGLKSILLGLKFILQDQTFLQLEKENDI